MKFAINRDRYSSNSRALILKRGEISKWNPEHTIAVYYRPVLIVKVTCDWDENEVFPIIDDTASIQYRPKSIYVLNGKYYYKNAQKKREYLTLMETGLLLAYILEAQKYLQK